MSRGLAALAATAASGLLYALAFPPTSWRPLAWVALVPFLLALRGVGTAGALGLGWFWAVFASAFVADALPEAVERYFLQPRLRSWAFAVFVWTVTGSLYTMGFAVVYRALARRRTWALPLLAAAAWVVFELLRGRLFNGTRLFAGNPWALIGYSQVGWDALVQVASLAGVYGVGFLLVAVNAALAEIALDFWRRRRVRPASAAGLAVATAAAVAAVAWGRAQLPPEGTPADGVPVAVVQGDVDVGTRWRSDLYGHNLGVYLETTREALGAGRAEVVFWPEAALTFFLEDEPAYQRAIARALAGSGAQLVVGGPRVERDPAGRERFTNSVFVLGPDGAPAARYDKRNLVPFSEFFPLRRLDFLRRRFERVRVFHHGDPTPPLPTRAGRAGVLVCNEAMYPEAAGRRVAEGAEILISPSNDTWIEDPKWADRMFDLVSLRAVEQRRWLVRASTSGPSAIVDPWGRVRARTEPFTRAALHGAVRPRSVPSVYGRVGDAFALGCGLAVAGALAAGRLRRARASAGGSRRSHTSPSRSSPRSASQVGSISPGPKP